MNDLLETLRALVRQEVANLRLAELAVVEEVFPADPENYECSVSLRDSQLVLKHVPLATARKGIACVPDVGDLVLVQFVCGDLNRPVITGCLYNDQDRPPPNAEKQCVVHLPADADADAALRCELNQEGPAGLKLNVAAALALELKDDDPVVALDVGGGNAKLTIAKDGTVSIESSAQLTIKSDGDLTIEAGGQLVLKGTQINLN